MNQLSSEEIINIEIQLLESPGKTLTTLHKHLLIRSIENQNIIFKEFDNKNLSSKMKKMIVSNVLSMGIDANANLRVFSVIILKLIFTNQVNDEILDILKSHLHCLQTNLTKIINIPKQSIYIELASLSKMESKKILVEFLHSLKYSASQNKIEVQCKKYPLALQLLVIFWRTVLLRFKVPQAQNYKNKISTTASYEILFEFLDTFYSKSGRLYLLRDQNIFIQNGFENEKQLIVEEIIYGNYYENEDQYKVNMMQTIQNPLLLSSDCLKIKSSEFNSCQFHIQCNNNIESVNPFQLVLLKDAPITFDNSHLNNSKRSMKNSNAFERRSYNLASNRSECSVNLEDSQCDNPTPSFNHITEDEIHNSFQPQQQSIQVSTNKHSTRATNTHSTMKESATILPIKNKILKSSLFQDFKYHSQFQNTSLQIQNQTIIYPGLREKNDLIGLDTADSPIVNKDLNPFENLLKQNNRNNREHHVESKNEFENEKKMMKRSQSQKNSFIRQSQLFNDQDSNRPSLFNINCKKLKTSMQIDDIDFLSQKKLPHRDTYNFDQLNFQQLCQHSTYTCSCYSLKLQKNKLISNTLNFTYLPQYLQNHDFKKKKTQNIFEQNFQQGKSPKIKSKLTDDFFKRLKIKRQVERTNNSKNKSNPKSKQQRKNVKKYPFIKYSQFIKIDQRSISRTPQKEKKREKNKIFPTNFKKIQTFFEKTSIHKYQKYYKNKTKDQTKSFTQKRKSITPNKWINFNQARKGNETESFPFFEPKLHHLYSSPITPSANANAFNEESVHLLRKNTNKSFENTSSLEFIPMANKRTSLNVFSPKSSIGFRKNDHAFYTPTVNKCASYKI